jgi:glycosyltransferase involved in cell wall biosynthesis
MTREPTPRKVLIIVENLPVPLDTRVWNEATALAAHGYQVSVICPTAKGFDRRFEVIDGVHIYRHPLPSAERDKLSYVAEYLAASYWQLRLALRVLRERGFDVIHGCNPPDTLFALARFFKLFGKRFIFDHHDLAPELYELKFGRRDFIHRILLRLERWSFRTADAVLAPNESFRRIAIARGSVDPARVWVVRSGPNPDRMRILPPNPSLRRGRRHLVGYVGLMGEQDGIDNLLEAAHHIVHRLGRQDVHFYLAGNGPALEALQAQSAALRITEHVTFAGWLGGDELMQALSSADVCVTPDSINPMNDKSTMTKTMEYMAVGKPVVQFETTEGRSSAQGAALYARPNDTRDLAAKIVELLDDPERCRTMGALGRQRVCDELAWSHQEPKLLAAYDTLFRGSPLLSDTAVAADQAAAADGPPRSVQSEPVEISVNGALVKVRGARIRGRTVVFSGKWLTTARIHDEEWTTPASLEDPQSFVRTLRSVSPPPDIFTFAPGVSASDIRHPYRWELEDAATIAITTYADWWAGLPRIGRKNIRRAARSGVVVERAQFDDALVRGIKEIYDETPIRQGRRFWHFGKDLESVRRANASYLDRSEFIGAYHDGVLIGFIKIVYVDRVARIMQILSSKRHSDKRPTNALLAKAVEVCCQNNMTHLIYGRYFYDNSGKTSLSDFKRRNGFERIQFPRYFIALTRKGEAAIALRLHLGLRHLVPGRMSRLLLEARARFYGHYLRNSKHSPETDIARRQTS